jgi:hypothetical protein
MGQQEIHEHEALGGDHGRRLHCRLTSFSRSLQTILRINLDGTDMPCKCNSKAAKDFLGCFYDAIIRYLPENAYLSSNACYLLSARTNFSSS